MRKIIIAGLFYVIYVQILANGCMVELSDGERSLMDAMNESGFQYLGKGFDGLAFIDQHDREFYIVEYGDYYAFRYYMHFAMSNFILFDFRNLGWTSVDVTGCDMLHPGILFRVEKPVGEGDIGVAAIAAAEEVGAMSVLGEVLM